MITVHRDFNGIRVEGARYAVLIYPISDWRVHGDPSVILSVIASPALMRSDRWVRLDDSESRNVFTADEIEFVPCSNGMDELRALHRGVIDAPAFRSGFALELEPGMRPFLETELPRVERVTRVAAALGGVEAHLGRERPQYGWTSLQPHELSALTEVAAGVVLDGYGPEEAIDRASDHVGNRLFDGHKESYVELGAALRQPDVLAILEQSGEASNGDGKTSAR